MQIGVPQTGALQVRVRQAGPPQVSACQVDLPQVGAPQAGSLQVYANIVQYGQIG